MKRLAAVLPLVASCVLCSPVEAFQVAETQHEASSVEAVGVEARGVDTPGVDTPDAGGWRVDLQPYIWLPAYINGTATAEGVTVDLDLTLSDVFDNFDVLAFTGRAEAWKDDRWGLIFDGMYVSIENDFNVNASKTHTLSLERQLTGPRGLRTIDIMLERDFRIDFDAGVSVDIEQSMLDFALGWRAYDQIIGDRGERLVFDVIGGARYQYLKQEIDVRGTVTTMSSSESFGPIPLGDSKDWLEPMIGGRVALALSDDLTLTVRGDVSGFGIGSGSDLTWNLLGGIGIGLSPQFDLRFGYRVLDIDYENGSGADAFGLDVTMHGPYLGGAIRF